MLPQGQSFGASGLSASSRKTLISLLLRRGDDISGRGKPDLRAPQRRRPPVSLHERALSARRTSHTARRSVVHEPQDTRPLGHDAWALIRYPCRRPASMNRRMPGVRKRPQGRRSSIPRNTSCLFQVLNMIMPHVAYLRVFLHAKDAFHDMR